MRIIKKSYLNFLIHIYPGFSQNTIFKYWFLGNQFLDSLILISQKEFIQKLIEWILLWSPYEVLWKFEIQLSRAIFVFRWIFWLYKITELSTGVEGLWISLAISDCGCSTIYCRITSISFESINELMSGTSNKLNFLDIF